MAMDIDSPRRPRRLTLGGKVLIGLAGFALLVATQLLLGHRIIRDAAERLDHTLNSQVRPLAKLNRLQSQVSRLRVLEVELPQLSDVFAVSERLAVVRGEMADFDASLGAFIEELRRQRSPEAAGLHENWQRYRRDLQEIVQHADEMRLDRVQRISTFDSSARFMAISLTLKTLAQATESRADEAFRQTVRQHADQRTRFLVTSVAGLLVLVLLALLTARSISGRLRGLRDGAAAVAEGRADRPVVVVGNDELSDLGAAFNAMQDKVSARERALLRAHEQLESRVVERTHELNEANAQLQREVDERRRAEAQLRLLSQAVEQSPVSIAITDVAGAIQYVNQSFVEDTGLGREEVHGRPARFIDFEDASEEDRRRHWARLVGGAQRDVHFRNRRDGSRFWLHLRVSPVLDAGDAVTNYLVIAEDITLRKEQEERILHQAQYDSLTDLPNRLLAMDRLSQAIASADRAGSKVALMFIDLDDFKKINDTMGHEAGDALLVQAAQRLRKSVRAVDTVSRLGGDEFLVIMPGMPMPGDAEIAAEKMLQLFARSFEVGGSELVVTPSIGLSVYPDDGQDAGMLLRNADLALYDAKEAGRNTYRFFNQQGHERSMHRLALERSLRGALQRGELRLLYQPLVATRGTIVGAEALLRWHSAEHGVVPPDQFIPIAERTGVIVEIGDWVLRTACRQAKEWRDRGLEPFHIAVNVSPRQFRGDGLLRSVRECLRIHDMPPGSLQIEVTEGLLMGNHPEVRESLDTLARMDVRLAMDDFGTGYSSLSYLKRFPFHTLKIDREFVRDLAVDPEDRALVAATVSLGKALGLTVVAEGVETTDQLAYLAEHDCDIVQGYLFGKPLTPEQFSERWLVGAPSSVPT